MSDNKVTAVVTMERTATLRGSIGLKNIGHIAEAGASAQAAKQSAKDAKASETAAKSSEKIATIQAATATTEANKAKASADEARKISELDTVDEAVDKAMDEIKVYAMRKSEFLMQAAVRAAMYDNNSGFLNMGMSYPDSQYLVNDGMAAFGDTLPKFKNSFLLGPAAAENAAKGDSKTVNPVVVSNGIELHIRNANNTSKIDLRDAEDGTRTFDGATGVLTEHASAAEAFEGELTNGDFRDGTTGWAQLGLGTFVANGGIMTITETGGGSNARVEQTMTAAAGQVFEVSYRVVSGGGQMWAQGDPVFNLIADNEWHRHRIITTSSFVGRVRLMANKNSSVEFSSVSFMPKTLKVLTSAQDFSALEHWFETVSSDGGNDGHLDMVRPYGSCQYGNDSYAGIPLSKVSGLGVNQKYSAFHDNDDVTDGYVIMWSGISKANQIKLLLDPINCLFYDDSINKIVQGNCNRFRSIRGLGNAWGSLTFDDTSSSLFYSWPKRAITPRGQRNHAMNDLGSHEEGYYKVNSNSGNVGYASVGHAQALDRTGQPSASLGYEGRCYLIPVARIQRHSQGVYEPTHCPEGCRTPFSDNGAGGVSDFSHANAYKFRSKADCYDIGVNQALGGNKVNGYSGVIGNSSGRFDTYKCYDAIYSGMIIEDMRFDLRKNMKDVTTRINSRNESIAGTKRGYGSLPFTRVVSQTANDNATNYANVFVQKGTQVSVGTKIHIYTTLGHLFSSTVIRIRSYDATQDVIDLGEKYDGDSRTSSDMLVLQEMLDEEYNELPYVNLAASPDKLKATFPDGCVGEFIPAVPDGTNHEYKFTRKNASSMTSQVYTSDDGGTWVTGTFTTDNIKNSRSTGWSSNQVVIYHYESLSDFTEPSVNLAPIGDVGDVWCGMYYGIEYGNRLIPSLLGKVSKNDNLDAGVNDFFKLKSYTINQGDGSLLKLPSTWGHLAHEPVPYTAPANDSIACKALHAVVEDKGLLYDQWLSVEMTFGPTKALKTLKPNETLSVDIGDRVQFSGFENSAVNLVVRITTKAALNYNAVSFNGFVIDDGKFINSNGVVDSRFLVYRDDWGDNGEVAVVDNESTQVNLNGVTVKVVCHRSKIPICIA